MASPKAATTKGDSSKARSSSATASSAGRKRDRADTKAHQEQETGSTASATSVTSSTAASIMTSSSSSDAIANADDHAIDTSALSADTADPEERATTTLRIDNFRRPFTLNAVKAFLRQCGAMVADGFWMNAIKTHCYVTYNTVDEARQTMTRINGHVWPPETGQALAVTFSTLSAAEIAARGGQLEPTSEKQPARGEAATRSTTSTRGTATSIDAFFLKTEAKPMLYYLPVTDAEVVARKKRRQA